MNISYRNLWNAALGAWVAVSELTSSRGKRARSGKAPGPTAGGLFSGRIHDPRALPLGLTGRLAMATVIAGLASPSAFAACTPASPASGVTVTCTGVPSLPLFLNTFSSAVNDLTVNVNAGAQLNATLGGIAMNLTGSGITLNNSGTIDPALLGLVSVLSGGAVLGNGASSSINITNQATGIIRGTADTQGANLASLAGLALNVHSGAGGTTNITNNGTFTTSALLGRTLFAADAPLVAAYGGAQVNMVNAGTLTGRVAFESSATGNTFVNAGTISGGVSMGNASTNTFTAVTGSTISAGGGSGDALGGLIGVNLTFAPTGQIDGGAGGINALILQNPVGLGGGTSGTGTVSSANYVNFSNLTVNSGTWTLQGPVVTGSTTLHGGVASFDNSATFGSGALTADGGTLQASAPGLILANPVTLGSGGLQVQGSNNMGLSGTLSGDGGLTKSGTGQLTLSGANTYIGGTTLNGGTLALAADTALSSGALTVAGSGTLATPSATSLSNAVHLNANLSVSGTNALTLHGTVSGAGGLIKNGSSSLTLNGANSYSGTTALNAGSLVVGDDTALGTGAVNAASGTTIDANTAVALANAFNLAGSLTLAGTNAMALSGSVNGIGGLVKNGSADLALGGTNGYFSATFLNAGRLIVGSSAALGFGILDAAPDTHLDASTVVELPNSINLAGSLTVDGSHNMALGGTVNGGGDLIKDGTADLALDGTNGYLGGTTLNAGRLIVGSGAALGLGALTAAAGTTLESNSTIALGNAITLGGAVTVGGSSDLSLNGTVSGAGALTKSGVGRLTLGGSNSYAGATDVTAGTLAAGATDTLPTGTALSIASGAGFELNDFNVTVGALTGAGTVALGSNRLTVGGSNTNTTFSGDMTGGVAGGLTKTGSGMFILSGINTYGGATNVNAGTLLVNGDQSAATGTVSVANGATLGGSGTIGGAVVVQNDGRLAPGNSPGTLSVGALNLNQDSQLDFELGQAGTAGGLLNDLVNVDGDLVLDGKLHVTTAIGGTFAPGIYRIFNYTGALTDNMLDIASAPIATTGLTVQLGTGGQVNLVNATGISLQTWDPDQVTAGVQGGSGIWQGSTGNSNWNNDVLNINSPFLNGAFAAFTGTGGAVTVDSVGAGPINVQGMQFDADGYVLTGGTLQATTVNTIVRVGAGGAGAGTTATINSVIADDNVNGGTLVTKTDAGTLVLGGANTYRGGTVVTGGALQVGADNNLGAASGGLTLDGGALHYGAGFASTRTVTLGAGGGSIDTQGNSASLAGAITGAGALTKTGAGTLTLTGNNTYSGGTTVSGGTLLGNTTSLQGDILNNANVTFDQVPDGAYAGFMTGTGSLTKSGAGTLTLTNALSNYTGGTIVLAGVVQGSSEALGGNIVNDASVVIDQAVDSVRSAPITGTGDLTKIGAGNLNLTGVSSFTGATRIDAGTLSVNGSIANSPVTVNAGGTLGGNGTVGSTTVASGGVFAPGNSIGTTTVNGNLTFAPGSIYRVETDPAGTADRINVVGAPGTATISGGTVDVRAGGGVYQPTTQYTIINAVGGVAGVFANVTSDLAFLKPTLAYDPTNVFLTLARNDVSYGNVGVTPNQIAVGTALQNALPGAQGGALALITAVNALSAPQAQSAFTQLAGEIHASAKVAMIEDSHFARDAGLDRLREPQGGGEGANMQVRAHGNGTSTWARIVGTNGHVKGDGNASRLDRDVAGLFVGGDTALASGWRAGGSLGYTRSDIDIDAVNASGDIDSYHVGVFAGTQWDATSMRLGASYSWSKLETQRTVAFAGLADNARARYDASTAQVFGEVGHRIDAGRFAIEPFAGLAYVNVDTDNFAESGGNAALRGAGGGFHSTFSTLGVRASTSLSKTTRLRGSLGWRHAFGSTTPTNANAIGAGASFDVAGVPLARNVAVVEFGVETQLQRNVTLAASYSGQIGNGLKDHGLKVSLGWAF